MHTLKVDAKRRIRVPQAEPGQVYSYEAKGNGTFVFVLCHAEAEEPFPPGSLLKYMTPERDKEEAAIFAGCVKGPECRPKLNELNGLNGGEMVRGKYISVGTSETP